MRIAICLSHFHPVVGGAERGLQRLAEYWATRGHQPFVITRPVPGAPARETIAGVEILRVLRTASLGPLFGATFIANLATQLLRRASHFDVIVAGQLPWESVATGIVSRILRRPSVVFAVSTGPVGDVQQILDARGTALLRRLVRNNSRFVALCEQGSKELLALGCPEQTIVRSSYGVDLDRFVPVTDADPERARTVLFLSRLVIAKNPHVLFRAWKRLNGEGRYRLLIAGDGPLAEELRETVRRDALRNVEFLGQISDVPSAHRRASVYVLPSPSEGCPNALLEAMASGLCPIGTRVSGIVDVIEDQANGLLFDHDDDLQLADALQCVLEDEPLRKHLSTAARAHIEAHFDLDKVAAGYLDLFSQLAGDGGVTNPQSS
jgi:glycosyltransferase involved in cell wall biosynthesis